MTRAAPHGDHGILCCEVGRERFAFRGGDVRHVERAEYMRADRGDDERLGTLRLGGQSVPVRALGEVLGLASHADFSGRIDGHIAVTGDRNALTGWLVDRVIRVAQPAPGDIVALPATVGAPATSWFEGIVWLGEDESALLLAPHGFTGAAPYARQESAAFERPRSVARDPEPVAVVFSTTVLPASPTQRYALSGRQIAAMVQPTTPIRVPGCSAHVDGVARWRGAAVPVIDFRAPADRNLTTHRRRVIAQCGPRQHGSLIAFSIDAEVMMCKPADNHRLLPDAPCPPFAAGMFDINGDTVALLDLDALLDDAGHEAAR